MSAGNVACDDAEGGDRVSPCLSFIATVVMWDSHVKDGYKRSQTGESETGQTLPRAAPVTWDGKKTSAVVEELLRNSSDKAYGANSKTQSAQTFTCSTQPVTLYLWFSPQLGWGGLCC